MEIKSLQKTPKEDLINKIKELEGIVRYLEAKLKTGGYNR
jgi:hypothetical protein